MRILFFHRWVGLYNGGAETHIKELAIRFAQRGHRVEILTRKGNKLQKYEPLIKLWNIPGFGEAKRRAIIFEKRAYWDALCFALKSFLALLLLRLKGRRYDVISVHFALEAILVRSTRWFLRAPYVFIHEGYTDLEAKVARYADIQIAISQHIIQECEEKFGFRPRHIPLGIDLERFKTEADKEKIRKKLGLNLKNFIVVTVGRLTPEKDIPTLLQAARIVSSKSGKVSFLIVGEGSEEEKIRNLTKKSTLENMVIMAGGVSDEQLPFYYAASDLFVLTETRQAFSGGIVFLEAQACGLPVISTSVGGIPESIGDCGILIPPRKPSILAEKILEVMNNKTLREELIAKGLERVKRYDWNKLILEYEKTYQSVVGGTFSSSGQKPYCESNRI